MEKLDILDLQNRCYRELSGGQQQRVLLARALCATKSMLLLDEPVAGLDPKVTNEMYELIKGLISRMESQLLWFHMTFMPQLIMPATYYILETSLYSLEPRKII